MSAFLNGYVPQMPSGTWHSNTSSQPVSRIAEGMQ